MARKVLRLLVPTALGALIATQWPDIVRYVKIKQMSFGQGHPELVPVHGRTAYPQHAEGPHGGDDQQGRSGRPAGGSTPSDRTGVDQQGPIDPRSPEVQQA
jgi:hypothetical protein